MTSEQKTEVAKQSLKRSVTGVLFIVTFVSVSLFLIAHYVLTSWAEASEMHHTIQHVLIFLAGCGIGGSVISLRAKQ